MLKMKLLRSVAVAGLLAAGIAAGDVQPALAITAQEHFERAQGYFERGDLDATIIELKNAIQRDKNNAEARLLLGRAYVQKGRGADAVDQLSWIRS